MVINRKHRVFDLFFPKITLDAKFVINEKQISVCKLKKTLEVSRL